MWRLDKSAPTLLQVTVGFGIPLTIHLNSPDVPCMRVCLSGSTLALGGLRPGLAISIV